MARERERERERKRKRAGEYNFLKQSEDIRVIIRARIVFSKRMKYSISRVVYNSGVFPPKDMIVFYTYCHHKSLLL